MEIPKVTKIRQIYNHHPGRIPAKAAPAVHTPPVTDPAAQKTTLPPPPMPPTPAKAAKKPKKGHPTRKNK